MTFRLLWPVVSSCAAQTIYTALLNRPSLYLEAESATALDETVFEIRRMLSRAIKESSTNLARLDGSSSTSHFPVSTVSSNVAFANGMHMPTMVTPAAVAQASGFQAHTAGTLLVLC